MFSLDTSAVSSIADNMTSLSNKSSSIKDTIKSFSTSNSEGFDFDGAKSSIVHNVEGMDTKINNTDKLLNLVVSSHKNLQNSVSSNNTSSTKSASTNYSSYSSTPTYSSGTSYTSYSSTPSSSSSSSSSTTTNNTTKKVRSVTETKLGDPTEDSELYYRYTGAEVSSFLSAIADASNPDKVADWTNKDEIDASITSTNLTVAAGTFGSNNFPYYTQIDYPQYKYAESTIGASGCGTTAMAMVATYLTDTEIDPVETSAWSEAHGYAGHGTSGGFFPAYAKEIGLECEEFEVSAEKIIEALKDGHPIILNVKGPGHFTTGGHYIVLYGITEEGKILVADPSSKTRSSVAWDISVFEKEATRGWAFTSDRFEDKLEEAKSITNEAVEKVTELETKIEKNTELSSKISSLTSNLKKAEDSNKSKTTINKIKEELKEAKEAKSSLKELKTELKEAKEEAKKYGYEEEEEV